MARKVFYSFHYAPDSWRTSQVRNIGAIEGNRPATDNKWEEVKKGGDKAIQTWIDGQLDGRTCTVVLIGSQTAKRNWIDYEIVKSWNDCKGVLGINIHNLLDTNSEQSNKGSNPFAHLSLKKDGKSLSSIINSYDPPYKTSKNVYNHIAENISDWIEEAIRIRNRY